MHINNINNFKAKGTYLIKFLNEKGEITKPSIKRSNFIHERFFRYIGDSLSTSISQSRYAIYYSTVSSDFVYPNTIWNFSISNPLLSNVVKANLPINQNKYTLFSRFQDDYNYLQVYSRFDSLGYENTFNYIFITDFTSSNENSHGTFLISSLILDELVIQESFEDIDCYYNLETELNGVFIKNNVADLSLLSSLAAPFPSTFSIDMSPSYCKLPISYLDDSENGYKYLVSNYGSSNPSHMNYEGTTIGVKSFDWISNPLNTNSSTTLYGQIFNTIFIGRNNTLTQLMRTHGTNAIMGHSEGFGCAFDWFKFTETLSEPFQSRFMKRAGSIRPFWEASENVSTRGLIHISGDWQPFSRFPECYRIQITKQGEVGIAEYQIWIRKFISMIRLNNHMFIQQNTWESSLLSNIPFLHPIYKHPKHHGTFLGYPKISCPWNKEELLMFDRKGITILNLYDGTFKTWDKNSLNILNVSKIKQVSFDIPNKLIYVACKENGLFSINYINNNVTNIINEPCHAVDVGFNSKVFAVFEGRLSNSDNWLTALPCKIKGVNDISRTIANNSNIITNSWNNILNIKINPYSTTYDMAIVVSSGDGPALFNEYRISNTVEINWWNINNTWDTNCVVNYLNTSYIGNLSNPFELKFWKNGNCWIIYWGYFFFNSTTIPSSQRLYTFWGTSNSISNNSRRFFNNNINTRDASIVNKAIDNLDWFGDYQEEIFNNSLFIRFMSAILYGDYAIMNGRIYTHINDLNNLIELDSTRSSISSSYTSVECIQIDGDLFLATLDYSSFHYTLFNIFNSEPDSSRYNLIDHGWIKYGWNGTNWEENNFNSKVTHSNNQKGIHNLDISFSNGIGTELVFEKDQYLLQFMCNGLMIDNTTSHRIRYNLFFYPTELKVPFPDNLILKSEYFFTYPNLHGSWQHQNIIRLFFPHCSLGISPDPLFYAPICSCKKEIKVLLNGIEAPLFFSSEKRFPDPGEVVFERAGNNVNMPDWDPSSIHLNYYLMFREEDVGKVVSGYYGYTKFPSI